MIDQVADAFERKDYRTAARVLKQLVAQEPKNPWVQLYVARLQEVRGKLTEAETIYRKLLKKTTNSKIMSQARQGLGRLEAIKKEQRQQALAEAAADPNSGELGVLVLEPLTAQAKTEAIPKFAHIMQLDLYSARLQLPMRGWRLYRTGPIGELNFYVSSLREVSIPCFSATLADLKKINVFNIHYFSDNSPTDQATVVCQNAQGQLGSLTFNWSEITQRVEGLLPIFEEVVDLDARRKLQRKTQTSDYARFCDLHLPGRNAILRLCDRNYQFQQGIKLTEESLRDGLRNSKTSVREQGTTKKNWENLLGFLNSKLSNIPVRADFKTFAETAMDFREMLGHLPSHIDLFRREETFWDPAFQLYSGLVFLRSSANRASTF
jgi:tetratricopeptide (TPR) repeat protein